MTLEGLREALARVESSKYARVPLLNLSGVVSARGAG